MRCLRSAQILFAFHLWCFCFIWFFSSKALSLILNDISNPYIFFEYRQSERERYLSFGLTMQQEEYDWIASKSNDSSVSTCIAIDGVICQCFIHQTILSFRVREESLSLDCRISSNRKELGWKRSSQIPHFISLIMRTSDGQLSSTPFTLTSSTMPEVKGKVSLVLTLVLSDLPRASILFGSLTKVSDQFINKLIVVVPDKDVSVIESSLSSFSLSFPVQTVPESRLFRRPPHLWQNQLPYATQMAIKLLVATIVETDFYMTLDADHICLHADAFQFLLSSSTSGATRAVYHQEDFSVHDFWWEGSRKLLGLSYLELEKLSFGVTPAVLSSWGSLATLSLLREALLRRIATEKDSIEAPDHVCGLDLACDSEESDIAVEERWLDFLGQDGQIWTEYTLYRLALEQLAVFEELHFPENQKIFLHCENVWFAHQLPWKVSEAVKNESCLFSVVQSSIGVPPNHLRDLLLREKEITT